MRILVIPAVLNTPLRQRGVELARTLAARHSVIVLGGERQPPGLTKLGKLGWHFRQAAGYVTRRLEPNLTAVRLPSFPRWPRVSRRYQSLLLALMARLWRPDAILTQGTGEVRAPRRRGTRIVYDLIDNHMAGLELEGRPEAARAVRAFIADELQAAAMATASSRVLVRILREEFQRDAVLVPNGIRVAAYRSVSADARNELRERLGLGPGPTLGFTGGIDWWVDVPLALGALRAVQRTHPSARLLVVGDGGRAQEFRAAGSDVVVTGFVSPDEVPRYVAAFDVGLEPILKNRLTDAMLPIKIFDYAAARKPCVSTALEAYAGENLPFLWITPSDPGRFGAAVLEALERRWDPAWDPVVDGYDWGRLASRLEPLLAGDAT